MSSDTENNFLNDKISVNKCKIDLSKYFHPENPLQDSKFKAIYNILSLDDDELSRLVAVDRTTMGRYRRGVWIPSDEMKIKICHEISKLLKKPFDSLIFWNDLISVDKIVGDGKK